MTEPCSPYHVNRQVLRFFDCPGCHKTIGLLICVDGQWWLRVGEFTCSDLQAVHTCGARIWFDGDPEDIDSAGG
jgi:hypothetical protein